MKTVSCCWRCRLLIQEEEPHPSVQLLSQPLPVAVVHCLLGGITCVISALYKVS